MNKRILNAHAPAAAAALGLGLLSMSASSHREAPLITESPKLDATDFYMFRSYETQREDFVTIVANYLPLQDAYGGPNYFALDPNAVYEIHIDNNGDAREDLTFQFRFSNNTRDIALPIGPEDNRRTNAVPLINVGQIASDNTASLNRLETYTVKMIRGERRTGTAEPVRRSDGSEVFEKPVDNIGNKSIPNYEAYARAHIHRVRFPLFDQEGRVFVGQRKDPFVVNLGETFDLVNLNPLGPVDGGRDSLYYKNVTSIVLEVPRLLLTRIGGSSVVGGWTTASKVSVTGAEATYSQVSRLAQPLVNEVVIGLKDKDKFNASEPKDDAQFADYVTHPTLPALLEILFGVKAPTQFPRNDLVSVFLTGVESLNQTTAVAEMLRLNTDTPSKPAAEQNNMGVLAGDTSGFPNGRRPGDDVVDMALRVVMGVLLPADLAPDGQLAYTDGAIVNASYFDSVFPYLRSPVPGSPNDPYINILLQSAATVEGPYTNTAAAYSPANQTLSAPKPHPDKAFLRLKADGKVVLDGVTVTENSVQVGLK